MFDVAGLVYFVFMTDREQEPDDVEPGLSEGDVHSGPGGYEGMGYSGGYAAEHFGKDDNEDDESEDESDFDEDEANR
jgi:hypothetical protein